MNNEKKKWTRRANRSQHHHGLPAVRRLRGSAGGATRVGTRSGGWDGRCDGRPPPDGFEGVGDGAEDEHPFAYECGGEDAEEGGEPQALEHRRPGAPEGGEGERHHLHADPQHHRRRQGVEPHPQALVDHHLRRLPARRHEQGDVDGAEHGEERCAEQRVGAAAAVGEVGGALPKEDLRGDAERGEDPGGEGQEEGVEEEERKGGEQGQDQRHGEGVGVADLPLDGGPEEEEEGGEEARLREALRREDMGPAEVEVVPVGVEEAEAEELRQRPQAGEDRQQDTDRPQGVEVPQAPPRRPGALAAGGAEVEMEDEGDRGEGEDEEHAGEGGGGDLGNRRTRTAGHLRGRTATATAAVAPASRSLAETTAFVLADALLIVSSVLRRGRRRVPPPLRPCRPRPPG